MSPVGYAIATVSRTIGSFHPSAMPRLTRSHYRRELLAWLLLPVMMGTVEGGVVGVIAKNAFAGMVSDRLLNVVVAILAAAPAFANITSFLWAALSHGRAKIRFLVGLQVTAVVLVAQIALAPTSPLGLVMLTLGAVGARVAWAGVVTLRATVWRANYPRSERATMAGKLSTVQALMMAGVGLAVGLSMRANEQSFHILYPLAALVGLAGAIVYSRMRMRGHAALVSSERRHDDETDNDDTPGLGRFPAIRILRSDRLYRRYMIAMFVFGIGNIMIDAPLVIMLRDAFGFGYLRGILIVSTIPIMLMPLTIPLWSRLLDGSHIIRFRVYHCWAFVAATGTVLVASVGPRDLSWLLFVAAAFKGIAFGGGVLAWNLGHTDFAPKALTSQYMGIHVTLTGIRGLIAPVVAVAIYEILNARWPGSGGWVFALCLALNLIGAAGFMTLHRRTRAWTATEGFPR